MAKDEEDYAEVEVVDEDDDEPKKYHRKSKRREVEEDEDEDDDRPSRLKPILAIICVVVIIFAIFLIYFFTMTPVQGVHLNPVQPYEDGIRVTCHILMDGGATTDGKGDVKIFYASDQVYSGNIEINRDEGEAFIDYDEFVEGNGEYTVEVSYQGKSKTETFNIEDTPFFWTIVENLHIDPGPSHPTFNDTITSVGLNVNVLIKDPSGNIPSAHSGKSTVKLKIQHEGGNEQTYSKDLNDGFGFNFEDYNYLSTGSGNYTFIATWENLYVKADSDLREIEVRETKYLNMPIYANAGTESMTVTIGLLETEKTVEFDASNSKNDGVITYYQWDFDFKDDNDDKELDFTVDAVGKTVSHTYSVADTGTYEVALRIWGKGILNHNDLDKDPPLYEFSYSFMDVTVIRSLT